MSEPSFEDKAKDFGWNVLTGIPLVGSVASGADALYNASKFLGPGGDDPDTRGDAMRNIASDALSIVPLVGTATSVVGAGYDVFAGNDTWGNFTGQLMGGPDQYGPEPGEENL